MGFMEKFKEFDRIMSEPCLVIETKWWKKVPNSEVDRLVKENRELRKRLEEKSVKAIETNFELLE